MSELSGPRKKWEIRRDEIFDEVRKILSEVPATERTRYINSDTLIINYEGIAMLMQKFTEQGRDYQRHELQGISTEKILFPLD